MILNICEVPEVLRVMRIVYIIINIIKIAAPIMLILAVMLDFAKAVKDVDYMEKAKKNAVSRLIAAVLIFLIPTLTAAIASGIFGNTEYKDCVTDITIEKINNAFNKREEELIATAEETRELNDYNNALIYLTNIKDDTKLNDYQKRLKNVKEIIDNKDSYKSSISGEKSGEYGKYYFRGVGGKYKKITVDGQEYYIVNTKGDLYDYQRYIKTTQKYQAASPAYNDLCLGFSYTHAWELYNNVRVVQANTINNSTQGNYFSRFVSGDLNLFMNVVYNELVNGRPVVIQVNGNTQGTSRHFVTAVGFDKSVTSGDDLYGRHLLIIDSYDGEIERMNSNGARFLTTGKDCGKDYNGYQLFYLNH